MADTLYLSIGGDRGGPQSRRMPLQCWRQQLAQAGTNVHDFDLVADVARPGDK
jgi:hypothetical protein